MENSVEKVQDEIRSLTSKIFDTRKVLKDLLSDESIPVKERLDFLIEEAPHFICKKWIVYERDDNLVARFFKFACSKDSLVPVKSLMLSLDNDIEDFRSATGEEIEREVVERFILSKMIKEIFIW